jgi:tRNA U34 2-thiouridine synthase MnmA/TrmU
MNTEEIIRMAREAGFEDQFENSSEWICFTDEIEKFAALVAAAEREACAKVCEELRDEDGYEAWNTECAAAIRARGEQV